jgi:hypothetical protein
MKFKIDRNHLNPLIESISGTFCEQISKVTSPIFVLPHRDAPVSEALTYGTLTWIDTGLGKAWVTSQHVLQGMRDASADCTDVVACIFLGKKVIVIEQIEVVDEDAGIDLAVFRCPFEVAPGDGDRRCYKVPRWPIPRVRVGENVSLIGWPASQRSVVDGKSELGYSMLDFRVSSSSDRHFVLANERQNRSRLFGDEPLPLNIAGMSGAPAFVTHAGWIELVGFLYEGRDSDTTVFVTHASFLKEDGTFDRATFPWI